MKKRIVSRRHFLRSSALALGALPAAMSSPNALLAESTSQPDAGPAASGGPQAADGVYRQIFPGHVELLLKRSAASRQAIQDSLRAANARPVVLAVFQMRNHCDGAAGKQQNLQRMLAAIGRAATEQAQILVFPEMCLPGYYTNINGSSAEARKANRDLADSVGESPFLRSLQEGARQAGMVVTFGFCLKEGEKYYNAIGAIDADGAWLGVHRKNPLYPWPYELESFDQPEAAERGSVFSTRHGKIALADCFDGEFPETIRRMRLAGGEILLWSNAALGDSTTGWGNRIANAGGHAWVNHLWVATCNCSAENSCGTSLIVGPDSEPLVILPPREEAFGIATINLAQSADWSIWRDRLDPIWKQPRALEGTTS